MSATQALKDQICAAFADVEYPGDQRLRGSDEGDEPFRVERDFQGKRDWRSLDAKFIDHSPDGLGSALSFFSHEAFRFYLPAYMLADVDGRLDKVNPVFQLTHGVDDNTRRERINSLRYGGRVWFEHASERFDAFTREEAAAVVAYLTFKRDPEDFYCASIDEAIKNYWHTRSTLLASGRR